jgi:drug/metabolite transporter (DMT)-like permease
VRRSSTTLIWAVLGFVWGSTWLFIKVGLQDLPPFTFAGVRFAIALVPLALFLWIRRLPMPRGRGEWALLSTTGLISFAAGYGLVFWGEQYISSGLTALLFTTYPFFGLILAHFFLPSEPLSSRKLAGVVLGVIGVAVIFAGELKVQGSAGLWGGVAVLLSAALSPLSGVLVKKWGGHLDPVVVSVWQMGFGGLPLLALGLLFEPSPLDYPWTPKALFSLFYLALVGTSLAFVLWYKLIQSTEVTRAQAMPLINTLVAALLGWLVLDEKFGVRGAAGGAAVLLGLGLTLWRPRRGTGPAERDGGAQGTDRLP